MTDTARQRGVVGVLLLVAFLDMLPFGIIIPFMPFWAEQFGASPSEVAILFSTYSMFTLLSSFFWGLASDRWGRKPIICVAMIGSSLAFAWAAQANALWELFAARALAGTMGGTLPVVQAYIADITPRSQRAGRMGLMGAAIGTGFVVGPGIGWLLTHLGSGETDFRTAFMVAAGFAVLGFFVVLFMLKEPVRRSVDDIPRSIPDRVRAFAIVGKNSGIVVPLVVFTMFALCMGGLEATFAVWSERQLHWGVRENALFFLYFGALLIFVQGGLVRPLVRRVGELGAVAGSSIFMAFGFATVVVVHSAPPAMVGGALIAIGYGVGMPTLTAMISGNTPSDQQGAVMGVCQSLQAFSRILGPAVAGVVFTEFGRDVPYLGSAALMIVALVITWRVIRMAPERSQSSG